MNNLSTENLIDRLGTLQAGIAELQDEHSQIRAELLARLGDGTYDGDFYSVSVARDVPRSTVDRATLERLIDASLLTEVTKVSYSDRISVRARSIRSRAA